MPMQSWISGGLVDQAVADQLVDEDQVAGVEHLELGPNAELADARGHRPQHAGVFTIT